MLRPPNNILVWPGSRIQSQNCSCILSYDIIYYIKYIHIVCYKYTDALPQLVTINKLNMIVFNTKPFSEKELKNRKFDLDPANISCLVYGFCLMPQ